MSKKQDGVYVMVNYAHGGHGTEFVAGVNKWNTMSTGHLDLYQGTNLVATFNADAWSGVKLSSSISGSYTNDQESSSTSVS